MKCYKIIFSPTGGTDKVADILSHAFGENVETVDLSSQNFNGYQLDDDSISVIAMPSFGGRAPKVAIERLKLIKANGSRAITVAVYGNREQEDTMLEMADAAKEAGFKVVAGMAAIAEHSIVRQYAAGRPNREDAHQLKAFAKQVLEKLENGSLEEPNIPGNRPYKNAGAGMVPKTTSACVNCGLCADKCPVGAIDKANPKVTDKAVCINCMRCVSVCPHNAKRVNGFMTKLVGLALKKECSKTKENTLYL